MNTAFWPHPGHVDPLAGFRGLRAVDTCVWLGDGGAGGEADRRAVARHRDRFGLSEVWVAALDALDDDDAASPNRRLVEDAAGFEGMLPFVVLDPRRGPDLGAWAAAGAQGVRLVPGWIPEVEETAWHGMAAEAVRLGLVVQLIARVEDARVNLTGLPWSDITPGWAAALCEAVAPAKVHISGFNIVEIRDTVRLLGDGSAPVFDLWFVGGPTGAVAELVDEGVQVSFGTGFPLQSPAASALPLMTARIDDATRRWIAQDQFMSQEADSS